MHNAQNPGPAPLATESRNARSHARGQQAAGQAVSPLSPTSEGPPPSRLPAVRPASGSGPDTGPARAAAPRSPGSAVHVRVRLLPQASRRSSPPQIREGPGFPPPRHPVRAGQTRPPADWPTAAGLAPARGRPGPTAPPPGPTWRGPRPPHRGTRRGLREQAPPREQAEVEA